MGEIRNTVGENIKLACEIKGIRQIDIAEHMGVSQASVSNWVKGNNSIDIEKLAELCGYLGVTLDQIYGLKPIKTDDTISEEQKSIREILAKKLKECRTNAGYTEKEVAKAVPSPSAAQIQSSAAKLNRKCKTAISPIYTVSTNFRAPRTKH